MSIIIKIYKLQKRSYYIEIYSNYEKNWISIIQLNLPYIIHFKNSNIHIYMVDIAKLFIKPSKIPTFMELLTVIVFF